MNSEQHSRFLVVHDHYKDSFSRLREHIQLRDQFLCYSLIVLLFLFLDVPTTQQFLSTKVGLQIPGQNFVRGLLWFLLVAALTRYFQTSVLVERQYPQVHLLENEMDELYGKPLFGREGKGYLNNYPLLGDWAHFLYTWAFPILLGLAVVAKIIQEGKQQMSCTLPFVLDCFLFGMTVVTTILYLLATHHKCTK